MNQSSNNAPLVCILGAPPDNNNLGVCALAHSLVNLISEHHPGVSIAFLNGRRQATTCHFHQEGRTIQTQVIPFRLSPRAKLNTHLAWILLLALVYRLVPWERLRQRLRNANPWIGSLCRAELIGDIRGGDSFSDYYGLKRLVIGSLPNLAAILLGRRIVYFPQTYGPFRAPLARWIASFLLGRAEAIYCRDLPSIDQVRSLLHPDGAHCPVILCPDVAFTLPVNQPENPRVDPPLDADSHPLIGLNVSGLLYAGGYNGKNMFGLKGDYATLASELVAGLLRETNAHLLLTPHVLGDDIETDLAACRRLKAGLPRDAAMRVHLLEDGLTASETKGVIRRCDLFIGSRMHACIAALSQGIPTVGLAYSDKFHGVFRSVGAGAMVVDARKTDCEQILDQCLYWFRHRQIIADSLNDHMPLVRARIRQTFDDIMSHRPSTRPRAMFATRQAHPSIS